jgi:hypothetical protein
MAYETPTLLRLSLVIIVRVKPKIPRARLKRDAADAAKLLNDIQALILTGKKDSSGISYPEDVEDDDA